MSKYANEIAFQASPESKLYKNYFTKKNEKSHFRDLAIKFINDHFPDKFDGPMKDRVFCLDDVLALTLSDKEVEEFKKQLCKNKDSRGCYSFRRGSAMDKLWVSEVCQNVNKKALKVTSLWTWDFAGEKSCISWSSTLWDDLSGNVYGKISNDGNIYLPEGVHEIKMSEYYAVIERLRDEGKVSTYVVEVNRPSKNP